MGQADAMWRLTRRSRPACQTAKTLNLTRRPRRVGLLVSFAYSMLRRIADAPHMLAPVAAMAFRAQLAWLCSLQAFSDQSIFEMLSTCLIGLN